MEIHESVFRQLVEMLDGGRFSLVGWSELEVEVTKGMN